MGVHNVMAVPMHQGWSLSYFGRYGVRVVLKLCAQSCRVVCWTGKGV